MERLGRLKADPVLFARTLLAFEPFPYQERLLRDPSRRIVACMGRQTGKSTTVAAKAVWFAATHPRTNTLIISATMRQSMLMMDKVLSYLDSSPQLRRSVACRRRTRARLTNGAWIIALPCGPFGHTLRGHTAHLVILDEAAFIPEEVIANVVLPMLSTTGGSAWMLSTPWDKRHIFYRAFGDASLGWKVYHLPSRVNPMISPEFLDEQRKLIGEERFMMEYEAQFVDDRDSYFPMTVLRQNLHDCEEGCSFCAQYGMLTPGREYFGGYDPGGQESFAAFVVVEENSGTISVRLSRAKKGIPYAQYNAEIADLHKASRLTTLCVDQTGLGSPIVEHLKELGLPVKGVVLSPKVKEELLSNLKILLEQKKLCLPHDLQLLNSLNSVEYERTRRGGFTFSHRLGTHDDLAFALALALWGLRGRPSRGVLVRL